MDQPCDTNPCWIPRLWAAELTILLLPAFLKLPSSVSDYAPSCNYFFCEFSKVMYMMSSEECYAILKITVLVLILLVLVMGGSEGYAGSAKDFATDMPTSLGSSRTERAGFSSEGPVYYPMADEQYLNKYLYGMDPGSMTSAAVAGVQAPIFGRLNQAGNAAYAGLGEKGIHQLTNDILVAKNLGAGQCASGTWVGDTTACPEALLGYAPGAEAFEATKYNPHA